jgi:hypothetical protein
MEACWLHDDEVRCVRGLGRDDGWPKVSRSWVAIFASSAYIPVLLTDVRRGTPTPPGSPAPRTSSQVQGRRMEDKVLATNVFRVTALADGPAPRFARSCDHDR